MHKFITPFMMNTIDFSEAGLVSEPYLMDGKFTVICGGITLLRRDFFKNELQREEVFTDCNEDMYLSGISKFVFTDVLNYEISFHNEGGFVRGTTVTLSDNLCCESYGTAVFPAMPVTFSSDSVEVIVRSTSRFSIDYNDGDLISVSDYCKEPQKYRYDRCFPPRRTVRPDK